MSCCGDVMKPIEAAGCFGPKDTAADAAKASEVGVAEIMRYLARTYTTASALDQSTPP
ncbi:hypothetical protein [Gemmatimonas sp.]|uniref:hypothetical protein n=1 Tax=Gemmatimonas sp. TaxID=1962908 RepID=UPI003983B00C